MRNNNNLRNEQIGKVSSIIAKMSLVRDYVNKQQILYATQKTNKKGL